MHTELSAAGKPDAIAADARWAAWVARGAAHDARSRQQALKSAAVLAAGVGLWLAIAFFG